MSHSGPLYDAIGELTNDLKFQRALEAGEVSDAPMFDSAGMEDGVYSYANGELQYAGTQDDVINELDEMYRQAIIAADNDYLD